MDNGKLRPEGIGPETQAALENIKKIVEASGLQMTDVASVNVYLADLNEFGEMNKVYKTFFPEPRPARATVQVAGLVGNARVEISAIAVQGTIKRTREASGSQFSQHRRDLSRDA